MLIEANNLLNLAVATTEEKQKVGVVKKIIVDRTNARILGFLISSNNYLFSRKFFLSESDILDIDKNGIVTQSVKNLINPNEVLRVKKILNEKFNLFGIRAISRSKKKLGKISDFVIDINLLQVVKFYIKGFFQDRIMDYNQVYKITRHEIIFKEDASKASEQTKIKEVIAAN